jgi:hypothetical protein
METERSVTEPAIVLLVFFGVSATFAGGRQIRIVRLRERSEKTKKRNNERLLVFLPRGQGPPLKISELF